MQGSFYFVTSEVEFQESVETGEKGARVLATFMELDTPSGNDRIYRIEEGIQLAKSLIGRPIRYGANWKGLHLKDVPVIGIVEKAWQEAKKIKGVVRIWDKKIVDTLKAGVKYLFSVGGVADYEEVVQKGKKLFTRLWNAICTHLQLLPNNPVNAGFPTAKMDKVIEINESVMKVCVGLCSDCATCPLKEIRIDFEEAKKRKAEAINKAIANEIYESIMAVAQEPWKFIEK